MKIKSVVGSFLLASFVICLPLAAGTDNSTGLGATAAVRFLEQSSWGPDPSNVLYLQQVGFDRWFDEQSAMPPSDIVDPPSGTKGLGSLQQQFFFNAADGDDQLRQRIAFALSEIWVVSGVKITLPEAMSPYLRLLAKDAFANFYDLMRDITLNPAMGHFLDMVNNDKPNPVAGKSADENYARELMQLFTLGEVLLNPDGTPQLDSNGDMIPAYSQETVENLARVFTGWTYPPQPGTASHMHNPPCWDGEMVAFDNNHDKNPKVLLNGTTLPAGLSAQQDLREALENIFNHPNVGPFVSKQLIQHLVTSNPSPNYVARVSSVFNDNGSGVRGDLRAVIKAILLDAEARSGDDGSMQNTGYGHLKEPILFITSLLRALAAQVSPSNALPGIASQMGQNLYYAPSVFNYFSPSYRIPGTGLLGPEFQIFTTSTSIIRTNFVNTLIFGNPGSGTQIDLTQWTTLADNIPDLLDTIDVLLLHGGMSGQMRSGINSAIDAAPTNRLKAQTALYLVLTSSEYQVAH